MLKTIIWFIAVIILVPIFTLGWCHYAENPKSKFVNYGEAEKSGIMSAGWIPTYIPKSSFDINETHNLDTNKVKMSFKYKLGDIGDVKANCPNSKVIEGGTEYQCEYFNNKVTIKLYSNGTAELYGHGD